MSIDCYKVEWTKPFSFKQAINRPEARHLGIYAFYVKANTKNNLLYIGKSQEIGRRIIEHQQGLSHFEKNNMKNITVRFGTIYSLNDNITTADISPKQLHNVESFFINKLQPDRNSESTKKRYIGVPLIVINIGKTIPFDKIMAQNEDLLKLLKANINTKKKSQPWDL
jgi:hypothetical protein